jgi:hypothetical protein
VGLAAFALGRRKRGGAGDDEYSNIVSLVNPLAYRLECVHDLGVEGVEFVGAIDGQYGKHPDVLLVA